MIRTAKLLTPETKTQHVWRSHKIINPTSLVQQHQQHSHHCRTHMLTQMDKTVNTSLTSSFNSSRARNTLRRSSKRCGNFSSTSNKQTQQQPFCREPVFQMVHHTPPLPLPQISTGQQRIWPPRTGSTLPWTTSSNYHPSLTNNYNHDWRLDSAGIRRAQNHNPPRPKQRPPQWIKARLQYMSQ